MWNCLVDSKVLCSAGYLFIISNNSKFILQTLDAYDSTLKEYYFCLPLSQFSANSDVHIMAFLQINQRLTTLWKEFSLLKNIHNRKSFNRCVSFNTIGWLTNLNYTHFGTSSVQNELSWLKNVITSFKWSHFKYGWGANQIIEQSLRYIRRHNLQSLHVLCAYFSWVMRKRSLIQTNRCLVSGYYVQCCRWWRDKAEWDSHSWGYSPVQHVQSSSHLYVWLLLT